MEYRDKCPSSFSEVENASKRLGCGNDKFGNNQYLCLPSAEKDSLIEFCHTGIMGLQEKGRRHTLSQTSIHTHARSSEITEIVCLANGKIHIFHIKNVILHISLQITFSLVSFKSLT